MSLVGGRSPERGSASTRSTAALTLSSVAILKVNSDAGGDDYIGSFVPFAAEAVRDSNASGGVSLEEVQSVVERLFGLRIPQAPLKTILSRARSDGLVRIHESRYFGNAAALDRLDFGALRADADRQHSLVLRKLVSYAKERQSLEWSEEDAEVALLGFLRRNSVPLLEAGLQGRPLVAAEASDSSQAVVGAFAIDASQSDPDLFGCLQTLVKGTMLASVLFFPNIGEAKHRFERLFVYFDTPVLLSAVGAHGREAEIGAKELFDLAYELGVELRTFRDTFTETLGVLHAARRWLREDPERADAPSDTLEYLLEAGYRPSDVELMIGRLRSVLGSLRVRIVDRPAQTVSLVVDEPGLHKVLSQHINYRREDTLQHDLDALTAVHRLRGGNPQDQLEIAAALLVTSNSSLVRASRQFFTEHYGRSAVPLAMLDFHFGTLLWLKKPTAAPSLPERLTLAASYAAINPPDALWRAYLREIGELERRGDISEDDYHLLRFSTAAKLSLQELTHGSRTSISHGLVHTVLERAKSDIRQPAEADAEAERRRTREAEERARAAEERARKSEAEAISAREAKRNRQANYQLWGSWVGRFVATAVRSGLLVVALAGIAVTLPGSPLATFGQAGGVVGAIIFVVVLVYAVLGLLNIWIGTSIQGFARTAEVRSAGWMASRLERTFEASDGPRPPERAAPPNETRTDNGSADEA